MMGTTTHEPLRCDWSKLRSAVSVDHTLGCCKSPDFVQELYVKYLMHDFNIDYIIEMTTCWV